MPPNIVNRISALNLIDDIDIWEWTIVGRSKLIIPDLLWHTSLLIKRSKPQCFFLILPLDIYVALVYYTLSLIQLSKKILCLFWIFKLFYNLLCLLDVYFIGCNVHEPCGGIKRYLARYRGCSRSTSVKPNCWGFTKSISILLITWLSVECLTKWIHKLILYFHKRWTFLYLLI